MVDDDEYAFRILGPVQVHATTHQVTFSRRQQRDLLALLLLRADRVIPVGHIVDAMWGEDVPRTAGTQVKNMVSRLRAVLSDDRQPLATVEWQPAGYRLRIRHGRLDLADFNSLVARARVAGPLEAVPLLREAMRLWRGSQALAGVRANYVGDARVHLDERRTDALEALFDAELACANHSTIVSELTEAVAQHPTHEGLIAQLMTALYRSGRTSDALDAYRRARGVLIDNYALEPSPRLRDLERRVLLGDPVLDAPAPPTARPTLTAGRPGRDERATPPPGAPAPGRCAALGSEPAAPDTPVPAQLPLGVRNFTGRDDELADLDVLLDDPASTTAVLSTLVGGAGVGKTALALHWAHRVAARFPDGQLYVNLRGFDADADPMSPAEALQGFLEAFAVPPHRIPAGVPAQAALYRSLLAGRRVLVVLDNAASVDQVRPLLPGAPGCLVLVTSRDRLTSLVVAEGAHPITVHLLTTQEAHRLLSARLGAARVDRQAHAVDALVVRCARLPLALAVVAARAALRPRLPLAAIAEQLERVGPLESLSSVDSGVDVRAVFSWSYTRLTPGAARLFRWLGLHSGSEVTAAVAASLLGQPLDAVRAPLAELVDTHLAEECAPGRVVLHDLLRSYAAELSAAIDPASARRAAVGRLLDHYLYTGDAAAGQLHPHRYRILLPPLDPDVTVEPITDRGQALAWFDRERHLLVQAVEQAAAADRGEHTWRLATTIGIFVARRGRWDDWIGALRTALATAERLDDPVGRAHAHSGLGLARSRLGDHEDAHRHLAKALALFDGLGDTLGLAYTHLRMCAVCDGLSRPEDSLTHARRAHDLFLAEGHDAGRAQALNNLGWYLAELGSYREAADRCAESVALHRRLGDRQGAAHALDSLGNVHHRLGELTRAATYYAQSAQVLRETGDLTHAAFALVHLGDVREAAQDVPGARAAWSTALRLFVELCHPEGDRVAAKLRGVGGPTPATGGHG
ncbi:BTAD domain-containing putative transcriptional regulator [Micromonospora echinofusca]|uniref:AfsR/SARP family transcriptional regulator n=1 Tax=Micromonospora echinofusca TaxID=47858 RepID=UPI00341D42B9